MKGKLAFYGVCVFVGFMPALGFFLVTKNPEKQYQPIQINIPKIRQAIEGEKIDPATIANSEVNQQSNEKDNLTVKTKENQQVNSNDNEGASEPVTNDYEEQNQQLINNRLANQNNDLTVKTPVAYKVFKADCKGYGGVNVRTSPNFGDNVAAIANCGELLYSLPDAIAITDHTWIGVCSEYNVCGWISYSRLKYFGKKTYMVAQK